MPWKSLGISQTSEQSSSQSSSQSSIQNTQHETQQNSGWKSLGISPEKSPEEATNIQSPESIPGMGVRNLVRGAYKVGVEAPIETVESLAALTKSVSPIDNLMKFIGTTKLSPEQLDELKERVSKYNIGGQVSGLTQPGETSEKLTKSLEKATEGYLKPQSEEEKSFDNALKMASTSLYGQPITKGNVARGLIGGFGGEATGKAMASIMGEEGLASEAARMAPMFLAQSIHPGYSKKIANEYFSKAREALPKGAIGDAYELQKELEGMIDNWKRGGSTFDKKKAIGEAEQILSKIRDGKLEFDEAWELKRDLNKNQAALYREQGATNTGVKDAREKIGKIRSSLKNFISNSQDVYPKFYENYLKGDEIHSAIENSKSISNWIKKKFPTLGNDNYIKLAFGLGEAGLLKASPQTALLGAAGLAANEARVLLSQMKNSPTLRKHYFDMLKNAMNQNSAAFLNSYRRFKKDIERNKDYSSE